MKIKDNDLIPFELAKKAKLVGFDKPVNNFYYADGYLDNGDGDNEDICLNHNRWNGLYSAPTYKEYKDWINTKDNDNSRNWTPTFKGRRVFF